jgi:hypothetical protein
MLAAILACSGCQPITPAFTENNGFNWFRFAKFHSRHRLAHCLDKQGRKMSVPDGMKGRLVTATSTCSSV